MPVEASFEGAEAFSPGQDGPGLSLCTCYRSAFLRISASTTVTGCAGEVEAA
jgi:hypothetical protein